MAYLRRLLSLALKGAGQVETIMAEAVEEAADITRTVAAKVQEKQA